MQSSWTSSTALSQFSADLTTEFQKYLAAENAPRRWRPWLAQLFPDYVTYPYAERHVSLWNWAWDISKGKRPVPYTSVQPRGGGKSTTAELMTTALGARDIRKYALYVRRTQAKADDSIQNIAALLETSAFAQFYPFHSERAIGKFGHSKGWRRNRVRTEGGFTADALGLDVASRGAKVEEQRPDLIILDDIDRQDDAPATTAKLIETITTSILPAGSDTVAILVIQNLISPTGFVAKLVDGTADYLTNSYIDGPHPAIVDFEFEQREDPETKRRRFFITGGTATWAGQDLEKCQEQVSTWGLSAFRREAQHDIDLIEGGLYDHLEFMHVRFEDIKDRIKRTTLWLDPAIEGDGDCQGMQVDALLDDNTIARLWSFEQLRSPQEVLELAILKAVEYNADVIGIETNQGGKTWLSVFNEAWRHLTEERDMQIKKIKTLEARHGIDSRNAQLLEARRYLASSLPVDTRKPTLTYEKAGANTGNKRERQLQMLSDYERGNLVHCYGTHLTLENGLRRFNVRKPYDLADAAFWSWRYLKKQSSGWS